MDTNFQMVRKLYKEFTPIQRGVISRGEIKEIEDALCLRDFKSVLDLRNLRDFVVLFSRVRKDGDEIELMDKVSAITSVIDTYIFKMGGEV